MEGTVSIIARPYAFASADASIPILLQETRFRYGLELKTLAEVQMQVNVCTTTDVTLPL